MTDPTKLIFACDESGAKGYADQDESFPGEVGVFAGILIPNEPLEEISKSFQKIYDQYKPEKGKLHIADLPNNLKESLRQDVYKAIRYFQLPCFWYAIHVAGLHDWYKSERSRIEDTKRNMLEARDGKASRIKPNAPRDNPESMHIKLFLGLYAHLIAFLEERQRKDLFIEVRSDQIDSPIVKNFDAVARLLFNEDPIIKKLKGFDTVTEQLVEGSIRIELQFPPVMKIENVVRSLSINPVREGDGLVLAADVLANSLNYLFESRTDEQCYRALNTPEAVTAHPLAKHLDAFADWGNGDLIGDRLYRHPKCRE
jgi:hypothetical protein